MSTTPDDFVQDELTSPRSAQQQGQRETETVEVSKDCPYCGETVITSQVTVGNENIIIWKRCPHCYNYMEEFLPRKAAAITPIYIRTRVRLLENNYLDVFVESFYDLKSARGGHELLVYQGHGTWEWRSEREVVSVTRHS